MISKSDTTQQVVKIKNRQKNPSKSIYSIRTKIEFVNSTTMHRMSKNDALSGVVHHIDMKIAILTSFRMLTRTPRLISTRARHIAPYTINLEPAIYRDSRQMFDSPQFHGRRPHLSQRWYLSHCSWINTPGECTRRLSSRSRCCFRRRVSAHDRSRACRVCNVSR